MMRDTRRHQTPKGTSAKVEWDTGTCTVGHVAHGRRHLELLEIEQEGVIASTAATTGKNVSRGSRKKAAAVSVFWKA